MTDGKNTPPECPLCDCDVPHVACPRVTNGAHPSTTSEPRVNTPPKPGRLMSVTLTEQAVRDRHKTVTRRLGWQNLKVGDRLQLCRKVMGRKPGESLVRLATVEVVDVRRESLDLIDQADVRREGFPIQTPSWFVRFFCDEMGVKPDTTVTRIEWRYLDA